MVVFHVSTPLRAHFIAKEPEIGRFDSCKFLGRITAIDDLVVTFYTVI